MYAKIVWDGQKLEVPDDMGCPKETQLKGSDLDNLAELAGRTCYDSLGSGRDSEEYHKHIIEVGHGSVYEHPNLTFAVGLDLANYLACVEAVINRPGVWVMKEMPSPLEIQKHPPFIFRITANMRAIREWHTFAPMNKMSIILGEQIQFLTKKKAPLMMQDLNPKDMGMPLHLVAPRYEEENWISIFLTNVSRGFSHELVRHKFMTAVSQRSTRYVEECDSHWNWHPLIKKHMDLSDIDQVQTLCKKSYKQIVEQLQEVMIAQGIDKFTARKQARGAARGILGNALNTELIFSASLSQWKWIFHLRCSAHADAEIRVVMNEVYELLSERFPQSFEGYKKVDCPDGIGYGVEEPPIPEEL